MLPAAIFCVLAWSAVEAAVPKCDSSITSQMDSLYPDGIPTNIMQTIKQNGLYSYVVVSSGEEKLFGVKARCLGIQLTDANTAQVTYKYNFIPSISLKFPVKEENGVLVQTDSMEYQLYVLYCKDGVLVTYRCCDDCSESAANVGIAVADSLKSTAATKAALVEGKALLKKLGLDSSVVTLAHCS